MNDQRYRDQLATARKLVHESGTNLNGQHARQVEAALDAAVATYDDQQATPEPETVWHLELFIPGRAAPQGSKQARPIYRGTGASREFTGKVATVESSKAGVNAWRADVRAALVPMWAGRPPLDGPLVLEVEFVRARPKSAPKSYTPEHTTYPDVSKLVRSTEDAITSAGVWADDARVVRLVATKRNAEPDETPGAHIRIGRLTPARDRWEATRPAKRPSNRFSGPQTASPVSPTEEPPHASDTHNWATGQAIPGAHGAPTRATTRH